MELYPKHKHNEKLNFLNNICLLKQNILVTSLGQYVFTNSQINIDSYICPFDFITA